MSWATSYPRGGPDINNHLRVAETFSPPRSGRRRFVHDRRKILDPQASAQAKGAGGDGEKDRIVDALNRCAGNQTKAAKLLGISRRTLLYRLDAFDVPRPQKKP